MVVLRLAIPTPVRRTFDYLPPQDTDVTTLRPGIRVRVPFGNRELIGILLETDNHSEFPVHRLKAATEILDDTPPLPEHLLQLARWASDYYQHPIGDALSQALPVLLRKGAPCEYAHEHLWRATTEASLKALSKNAHKQHELLTALLKHPHGISAYALRIEGYNTQLLKALVEKGLAESFIHHAHHLGAEATDNVLHESPLTLNTQQEDALKAINACTGFAPILLEGVTGSGKTEVYLQAIEQQLRAGKQALVLIPEIGLTPQTVARFKTRFQVPVVTLHSNLTDRQRLHAWLQAREGEARIIIGTRSAIFTRLYFSK